MTNATHTPGPWTMAKRQNGIAIEHREEKPYGWAQSEVALVYPLAMPDRKTGDANARLIAAAPDMLAALEEMAAQLGGGNDFEKWEAAKAQMIVAIAKAKGE